MDRGKSGIVGGRTRFLLGLAAISVLGALVALPAGPAFAKRIVGTNGPDKIVGTSKPDRINARGGHDQVKGRGGGDLIRGGRGKDRIKGGQGKDRLLGNKGADILNAVDGKKDRAVNGGPGKDVCTVDQVDLPVVKNCEQVKVEHGPKGHGLRVTSASGLTCGSALPLCPFEIVGDRANSLLGLVTGGNGVTLAAGAGVSITGDTWAAAGLYGCSADGFLKVTIGSKSVRVRITCTT